MSGQLWAKSSFTLENPSASLGLRHHAAAPATAAAAAGPTLPSPRNQPTDWLWHRGRVFFRVLPGQRWLWDTFRPRSFAEWRLFECGGDTRLWHGAKWRHAAFPLPRSLSLPRELAVFSSGGTERGLPPRESRSLPLGLWYFGRNDWRVCRGNNPSRFLFLFLSLIIVIIIDSCLIKWWMKSYELLSNWFKFFFFLFYIYSIF